MLEDVRNTKKNRLLDPINDFYEELPDGQELRDDRYGVINSTGEVIVGLYYKSAEKFSFDNVFTGVKTEEVTGENQAPQIKVTYTIWDNQKVYFTYPKDNVPEKGVVEVETPAGNMYYDINGNFGVFYHNTQQQKCD